MMRPRRHHMCLQLSPFLSQGQWKCHNEHAHHNRHYLTIIITHRASDEQVRHCQSWRRPCQQGSLPSSWLRSRKQGSTDATLPDTPATCCWSSGSRLENNSLASHLLCRDNMWSDFFVSFYENLCTSTHQPQHLLGILWILLLDISPPDSVKQDFSFEPVKYSLLNFSSFLKFLLVFFDQTL